MSRQWTKKLNINKYTSLYADSRGNSDPYETTTVAAT